MKRGETMDMKTSALIVKLAETAEELEQAFRLRYRVFVEEGQLTSLVNETGMEMDEYDQFCDHLIVVDTDHDKVVGTYRMLAGEKAVENNGFYSETEFDLTAFADFKADSLEVGRSCIDQAYRNGRAIQLLWAGIADYIKGSGHKYLVGCVSVPIHETREINELYSMLCIEGIITDRYNIKPLPSHVIPGLKRLGETEFNMREVYRKLPPLLKGYKWLGAQIAGEPIYDPAFRSTDFFVVLETAKMTKKYQRRFMGGM
ncbi:GNAT family N-acetyltransferase [Laceyella putida]|uniref:GNAT family N-acetyltransferase n=1 Tax=Laceyella putida TaxID=110101 RepID=A0ABW2RNA5_9BACL